MINNKLRFHKKELYDNKYNYHSYILYRYHRLFFNALISRGRKLWAFNFFIKLKHELKLRENVEPFWILLIAFLKITPNVLLYPLKLGGVTQYAPLFIGQSKRYTFAVKWIIKLLRDRFGSVTIAQVAEALTSAIYNKGLCIEKKLAVYEIGTLNRHLIKFFK